MSDHRRIARALLFLRLGVFVVFLAWTLDKFVNPAHSGGVYAKFYGTGDPGATWLLVIGALEMVLLIGFALGAWKRLTYGAILLLHAISTLSSWRQYLDPFHNLLFLAAWPMLAACWALYDLRDLDTLWTVRSRGQPPSLT